MTHRLVRLSFVAIVCSAMPAFAQTSVSQRPFQGLFGGIAPDPRARERLEFTVSLGEGYDDDVLFELRRGTPRSSIGPRGFYSMLSAAAVYGTRTPRVQFAASVSSMFRYYNRLSEAKALGESAGVGLSAALSQRTTFSINQSAAYAPSYLYSLFPAVKAPALGEGVPAAPDYAAANLESYSYDGRAELSRSVAARASVSGDIQYRFLDYLHSNDLRRDALTYGAGVGFARAVAQRSTVSGRYHYRVSDLRYAAARTTEHGVDVGLEYTRPLSSVRSVDLNVNLGSSTIDIPETLRTEDRAGRRFRVTGNAGVGYVFTRTWQVRANYRRRVEYLAELAQPLFAQGATVSTTGLVTRRIDVLASARYASGESAINARLAFDTYAGEVRLRYALNASWAAHAEYLYYYYEFHGGSELPAGVPSSFERQGVRVGLTVWLAPLQR